ncbi:ArsR family transcriptional regulator [Thermococci archaeon]|nr:MAG: ArsR family transcriptional regulator [Thermococci archaeon]
MEKILIKLGLSKDEAKILAYLMKKGKATARELELNLEMRQPQVSMATKRLIDKGYISKKTIKKRGKGRPPHIYHVNKKDIIEKLKEQIANKIEEYEEMLRDVVMFR